MGKLGLIVPSLVNIFHCISVLFVVSKDSEELIQCYTSLRNKEGISSVMQNFKYFRLSFLQAHIFLLYILLVVSD